jgi:hypothetical protein
MEKRAVPVVARDVVFRRLVGGGVLLTHACAWPSIRQPSTLSWQRWGCDWTLSTRGGLGEEFIWATCLGPGCLSGLYRLVSRHIEDLLRVWPERFERRHGPLRPVVERVLRGFIRCGDVAHGFARAWCQTCCRSYLVAISCRGRSWCPSCEKKRSLLWAEWLREEVLEAVPHRHTVMTIPRFLRRVFLKRREVLLDLAQSGAEALAEYVRQELGEGVSPGIVVSLATAGDMVQWHPHLHILVTDGGFSEGAFRPLGAWDGQAERRAVSTACGGGWPESVPLALPDAGISRRLRLGRVGAPTRGEAP